MSSKGCWAVINVPCENRNMQIFVTILTFLAFYNVKIILSLESFSLCFFTNLKSNKINLFLSGIDQCLVSQEVNHHHHHLHLLI